MGTIYRTATRVVVWLGDTKDLTEEDITSLASENTVVPSYWARRAFLRLLLNPYWTRVWIIQELAEASQITVFCGNSKLRWETFEKYSSSAFMAGSGRSNSDELKAAFRNLLQLRTDRRGRKPVDLLEVLYRSRYALSTDPKDKIYGLLGLAHDAPVFIPEPNYSQSVEDTYTNLSKALIEKEYPLDLIYLRTSRRVNNSLPSWVVDWRDLNDALAKEEFEHIQTSIEQNSSKHIYSNMDRLSFSGKILTVFAAILGTIDGIGSGFSTDRNEFTTRVVTPGKGAYSAPSDSDCSIYVFNALIETGRISAKTSRLPPIGLWSSNDTTHLEQIFREAMKADVLEVVTDWIDVHRSFTAFGKTMEFWNSIWTRQPIDISRTTELNTCLRSLVTTILSGMCIASLQTGELGWVHPQSQKGDKVVQVFGSDRYVVLRSVKGDFRLIGEARISLDVGISKFPDKVESLRIF